MRLRNADGNFALTYIDELVDQMLNNEYLFDVALPRIPNRHAMFPLPEPLSFKQAEQSSSGLSGSCGVHDERMQ